MRELKATGHVAFREYVWVAGAQILVNADGSLVNLDAGALQVQGGRPGPASRRHQKGVGLELRPADVDGHVSAMGGDAGHDGWHLKLNPLRFDAALYGGSGFRVRIVQR